MVIQGLPQRNYEDHYACFYVLFHCADACQVEGQAMILGDEGWPVAMAKGMQVGPPLVSN